MAIFQAQAYEALAANVTFTDEDMLLSSPSHNRPLYMKRQVNGNKLNRILIDPGASINLMPYKTFESLHLMPYMQQVRDVRITGPIFQPSTRSKGKGKQTRCSDEDSETGELFVINKGIVELHTKNSQSNSTHPERRSINYEADHVSQAINKSIHMPPNCMQINSPKQDQTVRRLKTFVITYQRKEEKKNARKTAKPILFYKGEPIHQASPEDDFGWENKPQNHLEPIQEMADMPENIKEMCKKQNIPQVQNASRRKFFNQLWEPSQVQGQPPFSRKDTRGLGYDTNAFFAWGFVPPLGHYKSFVYMSIDDRVFVPPSDVTRYGEYINVRDRVFVPPPSVCASVGRLQACRVLDARGGVFVPPPSIYRLFVLLSLRQGVCAAVGQHCLDARHSVTAEDLNTNAGSHVTTCGVFPRTWRIATRTLRTEHQRAPRTSPQHVRPI
ncbi:hypothetical protein Taro_046024 [Colocasia esculenta]|uniref:Uncharacterized protein n=1 Tax=Colocasia esculenta TaxID=4460 RepID=A0A843WNP2_COLES|nr:hypothetical protein [Colocasia esculenta]